MYKNYIKIAVRGFAKHKLTFFINLFGLALGLWVALLIGLWVVDELSINQHFSQKEDIYQIMEHQRYGTEIFTTSSTPGILAPELKAKFPEVAYASNYSWNMPMIASHEEDRVKLDGKHVEPDLLKILDFEVLHGTAQGLLESKENAVITKTAALKLFGRSDVVGESIKIDNYRDYLIQAVLADVPSQSQMKFEILLPYEVMLAENEWMNQWNNNGPQALLKLFPGTDGKAFSAKLKDFLKEYHPETNISMFAYPFKEIYLHSRFEDGQQVGGRIGHVRLFAIIGLFVLLIACINFMNLSTAKSQKRAKEVGVRKVVGAEKSALIYQFLSESLLITFFSSLLALLMVELSLPVFNELASKQLVVPYGQLWFWVGFISIILFTGLIAGSYPAFYLSATKVAHIFRKQHNQDRYAVLARKGLVFFQFILATALIISTIVVNQQIQYALNQNLGFDKDQLLMFELNGKLHSEFETLKHELEKHPDIQLVSRGSHSFSGRNSNTGNISWEGKDPDAGALFEMFHTDYDFFQTMGMSFLDGRPFDRGYGSDSLGGVILNKKAFDLMRGDKDRVEKLVLWDTEEREVIGVVEDFYFQSFHQAMEPAIILLTPKYSHIGLVRFDAEKAATVTAYMQELTQSMEPAFIFEAHFMDANYARMYQDDLRLRDLSKYFSILTILISCLGLLGLSAHVAEQKTKEIGIRKVHGASTFSILHVINREFVMVVSLSIVVGCLLAYWFAVDFLSDYAHAISFAWWFMPLAALLIMGMAYLTVTLQSWKATKMNPVNSLKTE
ncbi:ABC transporter permease [Litoribacter alkaliphilus]|uniref:ABC transporter permease n=1 Tax=Litoribacter ruber TaxID=702568 RepID=A0AAP2G0S0_9BACT|nr:ABC transporter permease [Litoribacter alkaliphilus]MBS9522802.1 ABC transporter permease [Litoribacter alkaliphilus]